MSLDCIRLIMIMKNLSARICFALLLGALKITRIHPHMAESEDGLGFVPINALRKQPLVDNGFRTEK